MITAAVRVSKVHSAAYHTRRLSAAETEAVGKGCGYEQEPPLALEREMPWPKADLSIRISSNDLGFVE